MKPTSITVGVTVNAPVQHVWNCWTAPQHIVHWNHPSPEWRTAHAENNAVTGGHFLFAMETTDDRIHFNFEGIYDEVVPPEQMRYTLSDGRQSTIRFSVAGNITTVTETFEPEPNMPAEEQQQFCAAVLNNFRQYAEHLQAKAI
ncbi:SRPBCC domain-containing protein [Deminuibacter soli]|uniref:Activator of Hsp90 ATPase homologue 1/2-like C-terminal domain-containing protein n=1 Tax=Deminuibacter soli TaxID=2291815 RepID=A0A3E1NIP4_9BACT|nr:SRPBCC domain-containing protein [Deminuibacter soli]RFM27658.1 hypothetical protein DXN05_13175 [Deminuibacter soli]